MCIEIEAKLKVESHDEIIKRLTELGAKFLAEQLQKDCYFDDANRSLTGTDRCLRLRRQQVGETEKILLTYKGPKEKSEVKRRQEIEIEVNSTDSTKKLLSILGYGKVLALEKRRQSWQVGECEVALDELPVLGCFVEIEGPDAEKVASVQRNLRLSDLPHIPESYAALMAEKLHQQSSR